MHNPSLNPNPGHKTIVAGKGEEVGEGRGEGGWRKIVIAIFYKFGYYGNSQRPINSTSPATQVVPVQFWRSRVTPWSSMHVPHRRPENVT